MFKKTAFFIGLITLILICSKSAMSGPPKKYNGGLEAQVVAAGRRGQDLSITVSVLNAGKNIAYLMLIGPTSAADNSGVSYGYQRASGISICPWHGGTGQCIDAFSNAPDKFLTYLTRVDPETTLSMIVQLHTSSREPYGSTVDFSTVLAARFVSDPLQDEATRDDLKAKGVRPINLSFLGEAVTESR